MLTFLSQYALTITAACAFLWLICSIFSLKEDKFFGAVYIITKTFCIAAIVYCISLYTLMLLANGVGGVLGALFISILLAASYFILNVYKNLARHYRNQKQLQS